MSYICPVCSADTHPMEEESENGACIHEKIAIPSLAAVSVIGLLMAAGII